MIDLLDERSEVQLMDGRRNPREKIESSESCHYQQLVSGILCLFHLSTAITAVVKSPSREKWLACRTEEGG